MSATFLLSLGFLFLVGVIAHQGLRISRLEQIQAASAPAGAGVGANASTSANATANVVVRAPGPIRIASAKA